MKRGGDNKAEKIIKNNEKGRRRGERINGCDTQEGKNDLFIIHVEAVIGTDLV